MKYLFSRAMKLIFLFMVCILFIPSGCSVPNHAGFAIYLTKGDIPPEKMPSLNHIAIPDEPLVGIDDILTYNSSLYQITLNENASNRISNLSVPMNGKPFVVCVNRKPIYWGVLWPVSSSGIAPASQVIVSYPLSHTVQMGQPEGMDPNILQLDFYGSTDPRNDPKIIKSLEQAGKLTTNP
jgi:hypothetical protein